MGNNGHFDQKLRKPEQLALVSEEIFSREARDAGQLGFVARVLAQVGLPHRETNEQIYVRKNGNLEFRITSMNGAGIPWGTIPRILLAFVSSDAVRTKSRDIDLGANLSVFLRDKLGLQPGGGPRGNSTRVRNQAWRLFGAGISIVQQGSQEGLMRNRAGIVNVTDTVDLWWDPKKADQSTLWESTIRLSESFYTGIMESPVPIDWRAVRVLKTSPMALDIYFWLTHRMSYLSRPTTILWHGPGGLQEQVGAQFADSKEGRYGFRREFLKQMKNVLSVYPDARIQETKQGLKIMPSPTHVKAYIPGSLQP